MAVSAFIFSLTLSSSGNKKVTLLPCLVKASILLPCLCRSILHPSHLISYNLPGLLVTSFPIHRSIGFIGVNIIYLTSILLSHIVDYVVIVYCGSIHINIPLVFKWGDSN